jgi:hypothetical protein
MQIKLLKKKLSDIEPYIFRHRGIVECRLNTGVISREEFRDFLMSLSDKLGMNPHPELPTPVVTSASGHSLDKHNGLEAMLFWLESGLHAYWWEKFQLLTLDMHSCTTLNPDIVAKEIHSFFDVVELRYLDLTPESLKGDNPKVEIRPVNKLGNGVFARVPISEGEFIAGFYGEIYEALTALDAPECAVNHAIQFSAHKWRDSRMDSVARLFNHSCDPNCGIENLFDVVAIRDIQAGEELRWDYAMTEDSNWEVPGHQCLCGAPSCRGRIVPYRELPEEDKQKYEKYTSAWLRKKYNREGPDLLTDSSTLPLSVGHCSEDGTFRIPSLTF